MANKTATKLKCAGLETFLDSFRSPEGAPNYMALKRQSDELRKDILTMLTKAKSGHPGGSLSLIDIVTYLYCYAMNHDSKQPNHEDRDRFILSKGHGVPAVYAAMAATGYFPKDELNTLRRTGSRLQGHPDRVRLPGIEASTGSLGQGLSVAQGAALAGRLSEKDFNVYCILGDGECQEGQVWEAAMSMPKFQLGKAICFLDYNGGQIDGKVDDVMSLEPIEDKWRSFNWAVRVIDGHSFEQIHEAVQWAKTDTSVANKPKMIIAKTVKGKGVSFMEGKIEWHGVAPNDQQLADALKELNAQQEVRS